MTGQPTRLVIVDDHAVFREGLRALFLRVDGIDVVGEAATSEQAVELVLESGPDVVLMDLSLPGQGGAWATERVLATRPETAVVVLTMHSDDAHLRQALRAGARGYLLKDADPESIITAVASARGGQLVFDAGVSTAVLAGTLAAEAARPFPALTERETEVLDRIAVGLRNDAIAARLGISVKTVQNLVSAVLLKLGARDRAHLVALARDAGLGTSPR